MSTLIAAGVVVAGGAVHRPGWLHTDNGTVTAVGGGPPPTVAAPGAVGVDLGADAIVVPGFVDLHVHGGGGASYPAGTVEAARTVIAAHRAHGTTTTMASLVSARPDPLAAQVAALAPLVTEGTLAGLHLEGPWISSHQCGAHDPSVLRPPTPSEVEHLLEVADGTLAMVTIAPELPNALDAIARLRAAGVVVAIGHTQATYEQTRRGIDAGATVATHLFNGMRPIDHKSPGPVVALLEDPAVRLELIIDGVHLHESVYRHVLQTAGPDRVVAVTDAMAAAGMPDGAYHLGSVQVTVEGGRATVAGTDTLAGSTATADTLFRNAIHLWSPVGAAARTRASSQATNQAPSDDALLAAVRQTSTNPAAILGIGPLDLSPGSPADLVVLGPDLRIRDVQTGIPAGSLDTHIDRKVAQP